mmetsp:Transcript_15274/g.33333  ORF Transcript_15274/g.33333 Transcript_15274/m.33333 type:complete len:250 (-) Transcript_15274:125-874(-)
MIPLYNSERNMAKSAAGLSIGFEADGMLTGYWGCNLDFAAFPFWISTEENGAALLRPELCPLKKYGFDARCRGWYDEGRKKADVGNGTLHITAPYVFVGVRKIIGQSMTSPLIDPRNNEHIGQVLVDYLSRTILKALDNDITKLTDGGFSIMITTESGDAIIAPGFSLQEGQKSERCLLQTIPLNPSLMAWRLATGEKAFSLLQAAENKSISLLHLYLSGATILWIVLSLPEASKMKLLWFILLRWPSR